MSAPNIEECIKDVKAWMGPLPSRPEILRILRSVKASRDELPTRHGGLMACDGCEKRTP